MIYLLAFQKYFYLLLTFMASYGIWHYSAKLKLSGKMICASNNL